MHAPNRPFAIWPVSLARIESVVSAHLGLGRVRGNVQGPCFSRQVSMYLAKRVGGWSWSQIGRFYNGRHHTTVLHAIEKIEALRRADDAVDALLDVLTASLSPESKPAAPTRQAPRPLSPASRSLLIEAVASRVLDRLAERQRDSVSKMVHTGHSRFTSCLLLRPEPRSLRDASKVAAHAGWNRARFF